MGNAGSNAIPRERHKSSDIMLPSGASPMKDGQPFIFEKKPILFPAESHEVEEEPYYTKTVGQQALLQQQQQQQQQLQLSETQRANEEAAAADAAAELQAQLDAEQPPALPTVFKWDGGGKLVYLSGTFTDWKSLPMVRSHGDFVTIIDLPEGDHQYKFCVDGEWKHDPKLVSECVCVSVWVTCVLMIC